MKKYRWIMTLETEAETKESATDFICRTLDEYVTDHIKAQDHIFDCGTLEELPDWDLG